MGYLDSKGTTLAKLEEGFRGSTFNELIEHHLQKQSPKERVDSLMGTIQMMPPEIGAHMEEWIDQWNAPIYDAGFWRTDTALIFRRIINEARKFLDGKNVSNYNDDILSTCLI